MKALTVEIVVLMPGGEKAGSLGQFHVGHDNMAAVTERLRAANILDHRSRVDFVAELDDDQVEGLGLQPDGVIKVEDQPNADEITVADD